MSMNPEIFVDQFAAIGALRSVTLPGVENCEILAKVESSQSLHSEITQL